MTDLGKDIARDEDIIKTDEGLIFNPYNPLNSEIKLSDVQSILTKYGIPTDYIHNMELYRRAFVHRSYTKRPEFENLQQNITIVEKPADCLPLSTKSNERLEFLGDGILECVTKYLLYRRFPKSNEGFMTEKKIAIVKNEAIGKIALEMGLHKWLILSRNAEEKKTRTNLKKLGCLFESFIGALFLDFNKITVKDEDNGLKIYLFVDLGFK
jgi:dsRNA-specific ribonuclease